MNLKPEQIPDEVVEAAARAVERQENPHWTDDEFEIWWNHDPLFCERRTTWGGYTNMTRKESALSQARASLAAALPVLLGAKTWRHTKPTEPGAYYVRGFNWGRGELQFEALVQVAWHKFKSETAKELVCNLHESTSEDDLEAWSPLCDMSDDFEWCGPIYTLPTQDTPNEQ